MHRSVKEEQQLLQLKAEALRLKLLTNQLSRQQQQTGPDLLNLASQLPKAGLVWRLANMPRKLRNKLLLGAGLLAVVYLRF